MAGKSLFNKDEKFPHIPWINLAIAPHKLVAPLSSIVLLDKSIVCSTALVLAINANDSLCAKSLQNMRLVKCLIFQIHTMNR